MTIPYHERLAVVTTSYPSGDNDWAGHFVRQEAVELARAGYEVTVITTLPRRRRSKAATAAISDEGVRALDFGGFLSPFGPPGAAARIRAFPPRVLGGALWTARVRDALRRERWDRVVAHWAVPSAWPAAAGATCPLEVVSHGADVRLLAAAPRLVRERVVSSIVARASRWRFVSESLFASLAETLGAPLLARLESIASVEPASLAMPDVSARAERLRAELGAFDVSLGRLVPSKRVDLAIDRAAERGDLLLVVGDGPERASLERRAARTSARVRFLGDLPRDEALAYLAAARTLVFASEAEGCSTVLREARALETPTLHLRG